MEIGFICPTSDYLYDPFRGDPHTQLQLLTVLERAGYSARLIDLRGVRREFSAQHVPECDLFLYSLYTLDFDELAALVGQLREKYPKALHVAGGPHAMIYPDKTLRHFDSVAIGEGEATVLTIAEDAERTHPILRLNLSCLRKTYEQRMPVNLNNQPVASRHFLPKSAVVRKGLLGIKKTKHFDHLLGTTALFSRGCPYSCAFCVMPTRKDFVPGIKYRSPENVKREIEYLKREYGIVGLNLFDEIAIPLGKEASAAHLLAIAETGIFWRGQTRADAITPEVATAARRSGCIQLSMGVESVSPTALKMINKRIELDDARRAIRCLADAGIESRVYIICGLPGEPESIADDTLKFLEESRPDQVIVSLFTVRPGTPIFEHPELYGIREVRTDWKKTMHLRGRYGQEEAELTFNYHDDAPWGRGLSEREILDNFARMQAGIKELGMHYAAVGT